MTYPLMRPTKLQRHTGNVKSKQVGTRKNDIVALNIVKNTH